jgi:hypothetical protein
MSEIVVQPLYRCDGCGQSHLDEPRSYRFGGKASPTRLCTTCEVEVYVSVAERASGMQTQVRIDPEELRVAMNALLIDERIHHARKRFEALFSELDHALRTLVHVVGELRR